MTISDINILNTNLVAGAAWNVTESINYSTDDYDFKLYLKKTDTPTSSVSIITATKTDGRFVFSVSAANTASFVKGKHRAQAVIYLTGTSEVVEMVETEIYINKLYANSEDVRSQNEVILDALLAVRASRATREQTEIALPNGRSIKYIDGKELDQQIDYYKKLVRQERLIAEGRPVNPKIRIGF